MQVLVRDNNVDQALKALKKKMQREGIFREMKLRGHYEKPSEKRAREQAEAIRRVTIDVDDADERSLLRTGPNPTWEHALQRTSAADVRAALAALPDDQRRAVELAYFEGYTYREVAEVTGVAAGTAAGRLRLGLAKLRDSLAGSAGAPLPAVEAPTLSEDVGR